MSAAVDKEIQLEIGHVLFIDIVGYSKLLINEQHELLQELNQVVRTTETFRCCGSGRQTDPFANRRRDGACLCHHPDAPVQCALEISKALKSHPELRVRMGIHSGPVSGLVEVNDRSNIAGAGINLAQRVMDCGDAGHILLSKHVAEDLSEFEEWRPLLHDLGTWEVKHGMKVAIVNLWSEDVGNRQLPQKFQALGEQRARVPSDDPIMSMNKTTCDLELNFLRRCSDANSEPPDIDRKGSWAMQSRRFSGLPLIGMLAVIYFIAGKLGLMLASLHASASPVWPPAGIALAGLLLLGYRAWPGIFIGAFLVNVTTAGNVATGICHCHRQHARGARGRLAGQSIRRRHKCL